MGIVYGIALDEVNKDIYVYAAKHVNYFSLANEEKDVWLLYLHEKQYKLAFEMSKRSGQDATEYVSQDLWKKTYK